MDEASSIVNTHNAAQRPTSEGAFTIMTTELNYTVISHVIESWEMLRRIKNYEEVAGSLLFQSLFQKSPQARVLFGFPIDIDPMSKELITSRRFLMHASYLIQMLDTALNMLGPDAELVSEIMLELGQKHVRYGVKSEMFPIMGDCLIATLKDVLENSVMSPAVVQAWEDVFSVLSSEMIRGYSEELKRKNGK